MLKRAVQALVACAVVLSIVSISAAQEVPAPVVRMGNWVEIGDDAFFNIIGNIDARYNTWDNNDFDKDVQDTVATTQNNSSSLFLGPGDFFEAEIRFGADFRYKKNLRTRILFETQQVFDGNLIDDRTNSDSPTQRDGTAGIPESGSPHVERFWIDYKWSKLLRTRVGADLWQQDPFGWLGDDDPSFGVFITPTKDLSIESRAVIQTESSRIGLTNDNDDIYYTLGVQYKGMKGHALRLDGAYFRFKSNIGTGDPQAETFLIIPSWKGTFGIITAAAQVGFSLGTVDGNGGEDYDVFGVGFAANVKANLGKIQPWFGVVYGSGDDDANDQDLNGFHHFPHREISGGSSAFEWGLTSPSMADYGPSAGANAAFAGGGRGYSTTGNPFLDRLGNSAHPGTAVAYSNAGTLRVAAGVHVIPFKGHKVTGYYQYVGIIDDATLVATSTATKIDKTLFHELSGVWQYTVNKHFDVRLIGNFHIPGDGTKDIASTVLTCGDGTQPCKGDDVAMRGTLRFRARF